MKKIEAVKTQLKFRKKVLGMIVDDRTLFQFSSSNVQFSLEKLVSNLKCLIEQPTTSNDQLETESEYSFFNFSIKSKEEREAFMQEQREVVQKK